MRIANAPAACPGACFAGARAAAFEWLALALDVGDEAAGMACPGPPSVCCTRLCLQRSSRRKQGREEAGKPASRALSRDTASVGETGPAPTKGAKLRDRLRVHPQSKHHRQ